MVKLKGKYLSPIERFVAAISLPQWGHFQDCAERDDLVKMITDLHGKFMSKADADDLVWIETIRCAVAMEHQLAEPQAQDKFRQQLQFNLVAHIESLPVRYTLCLQIEDFPLIGDFVANLSQDIRITQSAGRSLPPPNALAAIVFGETERGKAQKVETVLEIDAYGYFSDMILTSATAVAISRAKQCTVLLQACGVFRRNYRTERAICFYIDSEGYRRPFQIDESLARCLGNLRPDESMWQVLNDQGSGTLLGRELRPANNNEEKKEAFAAEAAKATRFLNFLGHPDYSSIASGLEWYHDSIYTENQTLAYLAACIGLEALLGAGTDSKERLDQMSKRLADRYAFLIGGSRSERESLIKEYMGVLHLRGELVHARTARLEPDKEAQLYKAQRMLLKVIGKELGQVLKSDGHAANA